MASLPNAADAANDLSCLGEPYADGPPDFAAIADALGGEAYADGVWAPAPGEPAEDRGLRVTPHRGSLWGVRVANSHAPVEDDSLSYVVDKCGLRPQRPPSLEPPAAANDNQPVALSFVDPSRWAGKPVPNREWFIEGVVPAGTVTLLSGDGGVGKSLLALQLAAATALGASTAGFEPRAGRAMVIAAEDEEGELHRRLADIVTHHGRSLADLGDLRLYPMADRDALLASPDRAGHMEATPLWKFFAVDAKAFKPSLIVLDTSADLFGGDEIRRSQVRQFVAMLRALAIETGAAVILLSHPSVAGMTAGTGTSGSTAWNNSVRSRLYMDREPDRDPAARRLRVMKANYGSPGAEFRLRWEDGAFVAGPEANCPLVAKAEAEHVDRIFVDLLRKLTRQGQQVGSALARNYAPVVMAAHPDSAGVNKIQFEAAMHRLLDSAVVHVSEEGPPSRRRRRLLVSADVYSPR
ncbi:AAA family ATPase [Chenggangzhangella methanolivorans]